MDALVGITGLGLVTPLGGCCAATWDALLGGRGIRTHSRVPDVDASPPLPRVASLAVRAAREALAQCGWAGRAVDPSATALVVGTSKGPVEAWLDGSTTADFGLASLASDVARHVGFGLHRRLTVSAACASGLHALIRAAIMLAAGEAQRVLVVAAEASVHPLFLGSFRRLGVLAPEGEVCRPFDVRRRGFLMSESAAAVCLEREPPADTPIFARLGRFAMGGDCTHLLAGDAAGGVLSRLISDVLDGQMPHLVHAHGTGTELNDAQEVSALRAALTPLRSDVDAGDAGPILYSHKGALGHTLGAAGLISVVLNCLCHRHGTVPGNINTQQPMPTRGLRVSREVVRQPIRRSIACAAGFGGPVAVVSMLS